jgi:hypothetical protein
VHTAKFTLDCNQTSFTSPDSGSILKIFAGFETMGMVATWLTSCAFLPVHFLFL